jgi:uncharacterized protein (TIGR03083 family)
MAASLRARAAGRADPAPPEISPVAAFSRVADAFHGTLGLLSGAQWRTPALRDLDVQGLVGHLTGVEEDVHRSLAGDPRVSAADHVESTQPAADRQAGRPPDLTRAEWRRAADRTMDLVRTADLGTQVAVHGIRVSLGLLLIIRAFELWVHENDIRTAVALPPSVPDASVLTLMTSAAVSLLPYAVTEAGLDDPLPVHLVLTGPGGGTWDVAAGPGSPAPAAVMIVADAVGFCRLVANRVTPAGLGAHVTGDTARAAAVLTAATTLALD